MKFSLRKPCNDCPFRRVSARGWLGPWDPQELLWALGRESFPCHQTIREDGMSEDDDSLEACAGASIFLNNKCERSRHPLTQKAQNVVEGVSDDVKRSVFKLSAEFIEHHTRRKR